MSQLSPDAVRVRDLLVALHPLLQAGDPAWRGIFEEARRLAEGIADPFSADDAAARIALIASHERLVAADYDGALRALLDGQAAIGRQRGRVTEPDAHTRLNDHEWVIVFNLAQLQIQLGGFAQAADHVQRCFDLAPSTMEPAARHRQGLVTRAALDLARQRVPEALAGYESAVEIFRREEPDSLGPVLLGLAQCQMFTGSLHEALRTLDRAEPLLRGDADALASIVQARAAIASWSGDPQAAATQLRGYAEHVGDGAELNPIHRQQGPQASAQAEHQAGELVEARRRFDEVLARARASGDEAWLSSALSQAANATQDLALSRYGTEEGERLHHAALALLAEAREITARRHQPLKLARTEVMLSDYVAQWHPEVDGLNVALLRKALTRVDVATAELHAASLQAGSARERRDFAALHAGRGFEVACSLAFRLGDKATLARLIKDRAARFNWSAPRAGLGLSGEG